MYQAECHSTSVSSSFSVSEFASGGVLADGRSPARGNGWVARDTALRSGDAGAVRFPPALDARATRPPVLVPDAPPAAPSPSMYIVDDTVRTRVGGDIVPAFSGLVGDRTLPYAPPKAPATPPRAPVWAPTPAKLGIGTRSSRVASGLAGGSPAPPPRPKKLGRRARGRLWGGGGVGAACMLPNDGAWRSRGAVMMFPKVGAGPCAGGAGLAGRDALRIHDVHPLGVPDPP